ncbi:hypothetical protein AC630_32615 [Bradyrhizobium sp. AS23.2]|nr:hypothetical protein AC630_32615 [Bradyrhizobium sp. AS23.2]
MFPVLDAARVKTALRFASGPERLFAPGEIVYDHGQRDAPSWLVLSGSVDIIIGADPNARWLVGCVETDDKGFVLTGKGPLALETTRPGVFTIGDVRSGSVKRVAAGVGEGAAVVAQIHQAPAAQFREAA